MPTLTLKLELVFIDPLVTALFLNFVRKQTWRKYCLRSRRRTPPRGKRRTRHACWNVGKWWAPLLGRRAPPREEDVGDVRLRTRGKGMCVLVLLGHALLGLGLVLDLCYNCFLLLNPSFLLYHPFASFLLLFNPIFPRFYFFAQFIFI